jgi:hypothetical protein
LQVIGARSRRLRGRCGKPRQSAFRSVPRERARPEVVAPTGAALPKKTDTIRCDPAVESHRPTIPTGAKTLRSFPLAFSHSASTASLVRASFVRQVPETGAVVRPKRWSAEGCGPPQNMPSRRWLRATSHPTHLQAGGRCARHSRFLDLKALIRLRVRCARPALQPVEHPMLPWASPIEGLFHERRVGGCPAERTTWGRTPGTTPGRRSVLPNGATAARNCRGPKPALPSKRLRHRSPATSHCPCSSAVGEPGAEQQTRPTPAPEGWPIPRDGPPFPGERLQMPRPAAFYRSLQLVIIACPGDRPAPARRLMRRLRPSGDLRSPPGSPKAARGPRRSGGGRLGVDPCACRRTRDTGGEAVTAQGSRNGR